ncbi:MAG TPA: porin [Caldimonas sp.]|jgi:predicted porin|nr:porin [Caldimonas sp.]
MIRSICAAAVAAGALLLGGGAAAQNAVLYGLLDGAGSRVKPVGVAGHAWQLDSGDMTRSFIGVRGSEDLGGGLRAVFRLESYLRLDVGAAGRAEGDAYWAREASVGLSGSFGTTVLGRVPTPLFLSTIAFNPFGESIAFSPAVRQYFGGAVLGDTRWNNAISYTNNARDPLRVVFAANADESTLAGSNGHNVGASVSYITGPFAVTAVAERVRNSDQPLPAGFDRQIVLQAGATYDFKLVRVYGQVGRVKTDALTDARTTSYQLGAAVPIGNSLILVAYGRAHTTTPLLATTDRTTSIAYDYFLSKNTDIYVAALYEKLSFVSSGNTIAGGVRVRF